MKNSQYSNQVNVSINDIMRLQFNEVTLNNETQEIIVISMIPEAAEALANVIIKTLEQHRKNIEGQKQTLNNDKELN